MKYVKAIDSDPNAFYNTFGESFQQFSNEVTQKLKQLASQSDSSLTMRLKVLPGGTSQIHVINNQGQMVTISGLREGKVYSVVCNSDGKVTVPSGLTVTLSSRMPVVYDGDWYKAQETMDRCGGRSLRLPMSTGIRFWCKRCCIRVLETWNTPIRRRQCRTEFS